MPAPDGSAPGGLAEAAAAPTAPLVFPTQRSGSGCPNAKRGAAFLLPNGGAAPLRCSAPNRCDYCSRIVAFENMTALRLDAEQGEAPGHILTLTTRDELAAARLREAHAQFWRAFRKQWGAQVEYCGFVEWTTGQGRLSGGKRRLHVHYLVKRLTLNPACAAVNRRREGESHCRCNDVATCVECWTRATWTRLAGAWVVEAAELRSAGGVVGYLALHHEKACQAPPAGWKGKRFRPSKGYFAGSGGIAHLREQARHWHAIRRERVRLAAERGTTLHAIDVDEAGCAWEARQRLGVPRLIWRRCATAASLTPTRLVAIGGTLGAWHRDAIEAGEAPADNPWWEFAAQRLRELEAIDHARKRRRLAASRGLRPPNGLGLAG